MAQTQEEKKLSFRSSYPFLHEKIFFPIEFKRKTNCLWARLSIFKFKFTVIRTTFMFISYNHFLNPENAKFIVEHWLCEYKL
jgi:hypothetical protein